MYRYIIGDVHGCFYTLQKLIAKLPKEANLIFVGDLVDKGNFSKETVEFVMQNGYPCILGNHEHLM
ncbi:MAG: metallophosphoesterase, partial [Sulfurovum sp.]|nr:metallophosphoesterase [Sulfurovum sp.]